MPLDSATYTEVIPHESFTPEQVKLLLDGLALLVSEERGFKMSVWVQDVNGDDVPSNPICGTVGCIGGHIDMVAGWETNFKELGMSSGEDELLFHLPLTDSGYSLNYEQVTRPMAIAALTRFITSRETWFDEPVS